jgi:predicted metal-dependent phosphoesterase TrpH
MTLQGKLIGIFVKENIPPGLPASKTIEIIRAQGAFISVAHPFDTYRKGHWDHNDLLDIVGYIDAIEVFNSRCLSPQFNQQAQDFAMQHKLLGTVGSDSHSLLEVGAASFIMPDFNDSSSLKQSLQTAQAQVKLSSPWVHFFSRYAAFRKRVATKSA